MNNTALGAKKQEIVFISKAHEKFYYEKLKEVRYQDVYHKALCYCLGISDDTFVLEKEKRASDTAKLYVTGRDTPYQEYTLRFRDCSWELVERKTQEQLAKETIPDVLFRLVDFMRDKEEWAGTATELLAAMGETETVPTVITKWLNEYRTTFLSENRICYQYSRRKDGRQIALARREGDSGDGGDSDIGIPPVTVIDA